MKYTFVPSFSNFMIERICGSVNCLASDVIIPTINYSQKHGSRAGEASKTTGSGYRFALAAG